MATLKQLIECEISDFFAGFGHPGEPETPEEMQSQLLARVMPLLAGLEREPVGITDRSEIEGLKRGEMANVMPPDFKGVDAGDEVLLYETPQLPQPAVVPLAASWEDVPENITEDDMGLASAWAHGFNQCRAAMLQGAKPVHDVDNTNRQFESLGLIVTSDERKMELPRCSKHPETELQVHPFEQLLSYPPQPAMYCPLCRPSVAKWVEFDNQLRQWKGVK